MDRHVDVMVIGDGILGMSIAFALADSAARPTVALIGRPGPAASRAAGAMLGVLGEITAHSLRTGNARARTAMTSAAARRWPTWRERVRARAGAMPPADGYGTGTFMLLNSASARLDDENLAAIQTFATESGEPLEQVAPEDIPSYRPYDGDRALRALFLPDEGFVDARGWLATLDAALAATGTLSIIRGSDPVPVEGSREFVVSVDKQRIVAQQAVVAAGVWTPRLVRRLRPQVRIVPVAAGHGAALRVHTPLRYRAVVRTPNRSFACGLHVVPQADGTVFLGGTNNVGLEPGAAPTLSNLHYLSESMATQFHEELITAPVAATYFGNRPIGLDSYPLLGATSAPGLWVATGTYREGLHCSPLIAEQLASEITGGTTTLPPQFRPERDLLSEWDTEQAVHEAARHCHAVAVETRMRPPIMGHWPAWLREMYTENLRRAYDRLPRGFTLPPDLAPLAYENQSGLPDLITDYLTARIPAG